MELFEEFKKAFREFEHDPQSGKYRGEWPEAADLASVAQGVVDDATPVIDLRDHEEDGARGRHDHRGRGTV